MSCAEERQECEIPNAQFVAVYKSDESLQCEDNSGISLDIMETELTNDDIEVFCSKKGNSGEPVLALCGVYGGGINIYVINKAHLEDAKDLGYENAIDLKREEVE